ncbi:helix-turn-helix transcriptional regulator [Streptomyces xantholiticus]|uniref:helix-turn-helix transcriptional regulator n=1 Tax=Streptomyces xantholiticus TaxID=68285 RepID=UPI001675C211|nr:LuxR family transcriptional regulator [Streptomyces xantholiticus]GGW53860.1 LuxR family transcriptional regulator [Streptomyces xantholiticus]
MSVRTPRPDVSHGRWPFVGREAQTAMLRDAWHDPGCHGVIIYGDAGVGKSRLAERFWEELVAGGFRGGRTMATAAAARIPLGAVGHLLPPGLDLSDPPAAFRTAVKAFETGGRGRFVMLVDDLHHLDAASVVLVTQLLTAGVMFLVATVRSGHVAVDAVRALDQCDRIRRIDLTVLQPTESEAVLSSVLGGSVERRSSLELHRASNGNLLFLRELVLGALERGDLACHGELWRLSGPPTGTRWLAERIENRLATVDAAGRHALQLLALAEPLSVSDLTAQVPPATVAELEAADLIHVQADGRRTSVTLAHPLYGEVISAQLPVVARRSLLRGLLEKLESRGSRRREDALRTASWQLVATGAADPELITLAAGLARHGHDYEQVLTLLQALPDTHRSVSTRILEGEALYQVGRLGEAEQVLSHAYALARTDEERLIITLERTQNLLWGAGRAEEALKAHAEGRADISDPRLLAALDIDQGAIHVLGGQPQAGLRLLRGGEAVPDDRARTYGLGMKVLGLGSTGRTAEAIELGHVAYEEHVRASTRVVIQHPSASLSALSLAYAAAGDLENARRAAESGHVSAVEAGATQPAAWLAWGLGRIHWLAGRAADSRRWYAEAFAVARQQNVLILLRLAASGLAAAAALTGDTETAECVHTDFDSYPEFPFMAGEDALGRAWLLAAKGDLVAGREVLFQAAARARAAEYSSSEMLLLTEAARLGGARQVRERLAELAAGCDGAFAGARAGLVAAMAARDAEALLAAAERLHAIGAHLVAAEAAADAAGILRGSGSARAATAAEARASRLTRHCQGAVTPLLALTSAPTPLTRRESEIALLAASGLSSKEIANRLTLSVRTVDNHLRRVFTKLGITTRRELSDALRRE